MWTDIGNTRNGICQFSKVNGICVSSAKFMEYVLVQLQCKLMECVLVW